MSPNHSTLFFPVGLVPVTIIIVTMLCTACQAIGYDDMTIDARADASTIQTQDLYTIVMRVKAAGTSGPYLAEYYQENPGGADATWVEAESIHDTISACAGRCKVKVIALKTGLKGDGTLDTDYIWYGCDGISEWSSPQFTSYDIPPAGTMNPMRYEFKFCRVSSSGTPTRSCSGTCTDPVLVIDRTTS